LLSFDSLEKSLQAAALSLNERLRRHPRRVAATVCALLGGFAVTAFGIAPLAPDAADLPQRLVTQDLPLSGLEEQLDALAQHALELSRADLTRTSDTADSLLRRLGVSDAAAAAFLRTDREGRRLFEGRPGKMVEVRTDDDGALKELVARFPALDSAQQLTHFSRLTVTRFQGRWLTRLETAPLLAQVRLGGGTIRSSLFAATDEARLPDSIASQLVDIFSTEIDFHRQLRKGDAFSIVFEALTADDQPITWNEGTGRILAAEFTNNGKTSQALWFKDASGRGAYFTMDGQSKRRAFLASPMEFSRVTSGFAMRLHPIMQTWRAHNGVDYGAPSGTPVRAVGDGLVDFAGWQNGYGNVVHVKHAGEKTTVYAHLSKLEVRKGQKVDQGQRVGLVGATGWATGPHLHFEFRVNGVHQDPLKIAKAAETVALEASQRPRFAQLASAMKTTLAVADELGALPGRDE
jgi:murein DD-endopeptidase MepM/ murein hydrolase activator NlpD